MLDEGRFPRKVSLLGVLDHITAGASGVPRALVRGELPGWRRAWLRVGQEGLLVTAQLGEQLQLETLPFIGCTATGL